MRNLLSEVHPELIGEWSDKNLPLTSDKITFGSNKKVWWKGACGYEWQTSVKARSNGEKCPICSGARVVKGINDLATLKPQLAAEWSERNFPLTANMVNAKSQKNIWWKCSLGHSWKAKIAERTVEKTGCKECKREYLSAFPKLAVMFYAGQKQLRVQSDYAEVIGIPLEMYIYLLLRTSDKIQNLFAKGFMNGEGGQQNERT